MSSERHEFHLDSLPTGAAIARPARGLWRSLLAGAVMVAVWLFLWSWFALEVVAPLSGARRELERREAIHERA